ncbi:conjugative relaxase-like TrwC/TraI family protein [Streptomyces sp. B4I13]|uniref:MobF family relaxase n=1 Tax=Streptomyces sp. B4I13 TaxID=3042271 RepID=UPI0027804E46|nr:MobF family relaxase [Streptomyces sp. B4I13]MDQ0964566.1 conjugative relaxase-like TrwC/TraI family protein [Streptomyces sp. B4I13]
MAWVTKITVDEQVEYRLKEQAGCAVVDSDAEKTVVLDDSREDQAVDYRLSAETGSALIWMGSGLEAVGLVEGAELDDEGKEAARRLMNGCHPETGARLIKSRTSVRAHGLAQLTTARLVEAIEKAAEEKGVEPAELFKGKPKQERVFETQQRNVHRFGEMHRMQVTTLHKLARAAGISLDDVYGETELATAWEHKDRRVDERVRGWDIVLDLPKSDSVVEGLMDLMSAEELRLLVHEAKRDTFRQLERWAGYAVGSEDGEPVRLATGGLLAWSVEHQSARPVRAGEPGDPHFHLHTTIANVALCEDGEWRSIANSGQDLHRHASAADAYFKARVRALTFEHFGIRRERNERTGAWEVVGIPEEVRDHFSRRAALVDEKAGADASRQEKQAVSMATKREKLDADATTMRGSWRQRAEQVVDDVDAMIAAAAPGPPGPDGGDGVDGPGSGPRIPPPSDIAAVVFDPETGLTAHEKTFTRAQALAAVANSLEYGIDNDPDRLEQLVDEVLAIEGYAVRVPTVGSTVMSSIGRYTTQDVLDCEAAVRQHALDRFDDGSVQLHEDQAAAAIDVFEVAAGYDMSGEQGTAVTRVLTAGHGIEAIVGGAGAGKSTMMDGCRIGWDATGTTYAGATLTAVAAKGLNDASGIPSRTVAAWLKEIRDGKGLRGIDVLVIDEATMVDDRSAAALMAEAARTGTKVVAIGDHLQLQAVGVGGWFREVHRIVNGLTLTENRRQEDAAERQALEVWRTGDHRLALELLAAGGRVHAAETADEARSQILTTWDELRGSKWPDTYDLIQHLVVLAARNSDVDALNLGAQQIRRAAGELGDEHTYAKPGGDSITLAVGDAVRIRVNDYRSRRGEGPDMLNGYRAVVTAIDDEHRIEVTWRVRDRREEDGYRYESGWMTSDQIASGSLSLGYAMTIAASQGLTTNTALTYGHGANAFATYPGITRARRENHLWLPLDVVESEQTQARLGSARSERERLERAIDAFARYLGQSRPDSMVSDLLHEPPEPAPLPLQRDRAAEEARAETERRLQRTRDDRPADVDVPAAEVVQHDQAQDDARRQEEPRLTDEQLAKLQLLKEERAVPAWTTRPYGDVTDRKLDREIAENDKLAEDLEDLARADEVAARALAEQLERAAAAGQTRGQAYAAEAGLLLDQADELVATAREELAIAAVMKKAAEERTEWLAKIEKADEKSRIALRLARTSRKEQRELTTRYTGERAAARSQQHDAENAARDALSEAWGLIKDSRFASALGVEQHRRPPSDVEAVADRFAEMRTAADRTGHNIDVRDQQRVGRLTGNAATQRQEAERARTRSGQARAEKELRTEVATKFPQLHDLESAGRRTVQQQRQAQADRRAEIRARNAASTTYTPPSQGRSSGRSR